MELNISFSKQKKGKTEVVECEKHMKKGSKITF